MKNIGIILAGGSGQRIGKGLPKQFLPLAGKTILEYSVSAFQENPGIDEIFIITHPDYIQETEKVLPPRLFPKISKILRGGEQRYHSTLAALRNCPPEECNLIIHDAARPLVSQRIISDCIGALDRFAACTTAFPSTDTMLVSDPTCRFIQEIPSRHFLFNVQTPQGFKNHILRQAYERGLKDPDFHPTDDCGIVKKYMPEIPVRIIQGHPDNLKITYPTDLIIAEKILSGTSPSPKET